MKEYVLIGGQFDGRRVQPPADGDYYVLYLQVGDNPVEEHRYVRERLFVAGAPLDFYRHEKVSTMEALVKVFGAYGK